MDLVVVERSFEAPVEFEAIQAIEDRGAWCLEMHDVRFVRTFFSLDRRRMICLYTAPDAESVRLAQRQAGVPFERAWPASILDEPSPPTPGTATDPAEREPGPVTCIVERWFENAMAVDQIRRKQESGAWCFEQYGVRRIMGCLSADGQRQICHFETPDLESLRILNRTIGMPYTQLWPATIHDPPR